MSMKAYFITSDTHIRKIRMIADVTADILKLKTVALEICSSISNCVLEKDCIEIETF